MEQIKRQEGKVETLAEIFKLKKLDWVWHEAFSDQTHLAPLICRD